jgi:putative radical SAM enzyme (TIGR03279 family)
MQNKCGVEIETVMQGSAAEKEGLLPGDLLLSVNGHRLNDGIDFMFYRNEPELNIGAVRKGKKMSLKVLPKETGDIGVTLKPFKIKRCTNNCIFCFVSQLPKGLRKSLYIKDEDYRMSFLYGNYITLTNLSAQDKKRIAQQRLSPLYISVHSTNKVIRNTLLGNSKAGDVLKELKFLKENKIRMHVQIVLCPGYNDDKELQRTIRGLYGFYPYVSSIAVVPVGITMHRKQAIKPVEKEDASKALDIIDSFQKRFRKKHGVAVVYGADELYIKGGVNFPALSEYGELPQIENGVGMVQLFMSQSRKTGHHFSSLSPQLKKKKFLTFTGTSFYPYLKKFTDRLLEKEGININVIPVENTFFGKAITVTGLLTGRDVIRSLSDKTDGCECLFVPDTVMKEGENVLLDDTSMEDIENALGIKVNVIESAPEGIMKGMEAVC